MTTVGSALQLPLETAAQNDQLWKIIEKQRLIIQNLQKTLTQVRTERDHLLKKCRDCDPSDQASTDSSDASIPSRIGQEEVIYSEIQESTLQHLSVAEQGDSLPQGPIPPPRSPYRQNSGKDASTGNLTAITTHLTYSNVSSATNSPQHYYHSEKEVSPVSDQASFYGSLSLKIPPYSASSSPTSQESTSTRDQNRQGANDTMSTSRLYESYPSSSSTDESTLSTDIKSEAIETSVEIDTLIPPVRKESHQHKEQPPIEQTMASAETPTSAGGQKPSRPKRTRQDVSVPFARTLGQEFVHYSLMTSAASTISLAYLNPKSKLEIDLAEAAAKRKRLDTPEKKTLRENSATLAVKVISSNIRSNEKGKEVMYFTIAITKASEAEPGQTEELWRIEKLYSEFLSLDSLVCILTWIGKRLLQVRYIGKKIGKLPDKALFTTHAPNKVDQRKSAIEKYLNHAIQIQLRNNDCLHEFLSTSRVEMKESPIYPPGRKYGYLTKRGKNFGGWKARYFVLENSDLLYYDVKDGNLLGCIALFNAQIGRQVAQTQNSSEASTDNKAFRHAFLILESKKTAPNGVQRHVLCAGSDSERDLWVEALTNYINTPSLADEEEILKREQIMKSTRKIKKLYKPSANDPAFLEQFDNNVGSQTHKPFHLLRSTSDTTLIPSESMLSDISDTSTLSSNREEGTHILHHRSSMDHLSSYQKNYSKRNSISFSPREGPDTIQNSYYLARPITPLEGQQKNSLDNEVEPPVDFEVKKAKQRMNRRTFWGKRIFTSSSNESQGDFLQSAHSMNSTNPNTQNSPYGGLRGFITRGNFDNSEKSKSSNQSQVKSLRPVFGVSLEEAVRISRISDKYELPAIVYRCIEYLEANKAVDEEGIYRLSGSAMKIKELKERFNQENSLFVEGDVQLLDSEEYHDPHVIAGLLKMWLRELPNNVLTIELIKEFLLVIDLNDREERVAELGRLVSVLPLANYTLLRSLSAHLVCIVQNAEVNKMTIRNIGIVFSATLGIPIGIFNLFLTEFNDVFWAEDSLDPVVINTPNTLGYDPILYHQNQELYGFFPPKEESSTINNNLTVNYGVSSQEEMVRSNRNSMHYMDGAPQAMVGLEMRIDVISIEDEDEADNDLNLSEDDALYNGENDASYHEENDASYQKENDTSYNNENNLYLYHSLH
ncbi:hypothetical protein BDF14DRAFT_1879763 [Spinellus fusiger]|nr:hypothetical protein BDF14DRAFT_1879763 [Spinellus fusiger]